MLQMADEAGHLGRGPNAKVVPEEPLIPAVLPERLAVVALGEVHRDQRPVRALTERLGPHSRSPA